MLLLLSTRLELTFCMQFGLPCRSFPESRGSRQQKTPPEVSFDVQEVVAFVSDLLLAPSEVFSSSFFVQPMFPFMVLYEVCTLFGCDTIDQVYLDPLQLTAIERNNRSFIMYVWLRLFLDCTIDVCKAVLRRYVITRGQDNPLAQTIAPVPGSQAPLGGGIFAAVWW